MSFTGKMLVACVGASVVPALAQTNTPEPKKEARVTQIIKDVKLLSFQVPARPAIVNDEVRENTAVRTGDESRSELTFEDLTITRLGANTIFSFNKAGRSGTLGSGAVLLRVPKDSGGAEFRTPAVTVGVTGTTVILETTREGRDKLTVLEGDAKLSLVKHPEELSAIRAGQMLDVKADAAKIPPAKAVDLEKIMRTSPLITDFPPLPSQDLILAAINEQQASSPGGSAAPREKSRPSKSPTPQPAGTYAPTPQPTFTPTYTPVFTPWPRQTPIYTPKPKSAGTPRLDPIFTPRPKPKASPRTVPISTPTPKPTPQATLPPGKLNLPKGHVKLPRRGTPTPTPPRIN
jgi:FecR-like protein